MSYIAIRVEELGKQYRRGSPRERYKTIRESIYAGVSKPWQAIRAAVHGNLRPGTRENTFWALRNLNFEIQNGDVVGIIGHNGAGKSTLLKVLSRITEPTTGSATIHGRVGSLLEVGTGFHPELTGSENIFLNGAILGMKKEEIQRKFDEIVAFAEIEKFLDTPVKHYSSGMYMRLAFSVAAHLETEILFIDEVLAVGDLGFQKKCLGKMGEVAAKGRTVCFVSHQMNQIRRLCSRVIWLQDGTIKQDGLTGAIVSEYEASFSAKGTPSSIKTAQAAMRTVGFVGWELVGVALEDPHALTHFNPTTVRFLLYAPRKISSWHHGIALQTQDNQLLWATALNGQSLDPGLHAIDYELPILPLKPGLYEWTVSMWEEGTLLHIWNALPSFTVTAPPVTHPDDNWSGLLNIPYKIRVTTLDSIVPREVVTPTNTKLTT